MAMGGYTLLIGELRGCNAHKPVCMSVVADDPVNRNCIGHSDGVRLLHAADR